MCHFYVVYSYSFLPQMKWSFILLVSYADGVTFINAHSDCFDENSIENYRSVYSTEMVTYSSV